MAEARIDWSLDGGYSNLLNESRLQVALEAAPLDLRFDQSPVKLLQKAEPLELVWRVKGNYRGQISSFGWSLTPQSRIRNLVIPAGGHYLGRFKVPGEHFAVQWTVEGSAEGTLSQGTRRSLIGTQAGTRLTQSWVCTFSREESLEVALLKSWQQFCNPMDPRSAVMLPEEQVLRWLWTGKISLLIDGSIDFRLGWRTGWESEMARIAGIVESLPAISAGLRLQRTGTFSLQLSRRRGKLRFSVTREGKRSLSAAISAGVLLRNSIRLGSSNRWIDPLVDPFEKAVRKAVTRRLEAGLSLTHSRLRRSRRLLRAEWESSDANERIEEEYSALLRGKPSLVGFSGSLQGEFVTEKSRQVEIKVNFLQLGTVGIGSKRDQEVKVSLTPDGQIVIERGSLFEKTRFRWDMVQLMRLTQREKVTGGEHDKELRWFFSNTGSMSRRELGRFLKLALKSGTIRQFDLPPSSEFPKALEILWVTRFTSKGIEAVKGHDRSQWWDALVRALKIAYPERYGSSSYWEDWIRYKKVRELVDENPVQAHLPTLYPVPSRTEVQRRAVVNQYLTVKAFLRLLDAWKNGKDEKIKERLDLPCFIFFHLLCPESERVSALSLSGELQGFWGDLKILEM